MKPCPNCRVVYSDDYAGTCAECGAPMGGVQGNTQGDLQFRFARQVQTSSRENSNEQAFKRGNYSGVSLEQSIIDKAAEYVIFDPSKLRVDDET